MEANSSNRTGSQGNDGTHRTLRMGSTNNSVSSQSMVGSTNLIASVNSHFSLQNHIRNCDKAAVTVVVTQKLFPKIKFVDMDRNLAYETHKKSIAHYVITTVNLSQEQDEVLWWATARKWVKSLLHQQRNDRNTAVKNAFFGKSNGEP